MKPGSYVWLAWLSGTLSSFAVLETLAVRYRLFPPLTYVLRFLLGIHPKTAYGRFLLAAFAGVWVWLCCHLVNVVADELELSPGSSIDAYTVRSVDLKESPHRKEGSWTRP